MPESSPGLCACGRQGCSDGSEQVTPAPGVAHMSGPQHYAEAERLITENAWTHVGGKNSSGPLLHTDEVRRDVIATAQVHATLARVAAAVEQTAARGPGDIDPAWYPVLGWSAGVGEAE